MIFINELSTVILSLWLATSSTNLHTLIVKKYSNEPTYDNICITEVC